MSGTIKPKYELDTVTTKEILRNKVINDVLTFLGEKDIIEKYIVDEITIKKLIKILYYYQVLILYLVL